MKEKYVLGVHVGHGRSAALIKNGIVVGNMAQERLDRIKYSRSIKIPFDTIDALLKYNHITIENIACVGISGDAMEKECILESLKTDFYCYYHCNAPIYFVSHHDSHAYASFYASDFLNSLIFIADGGGDYYNNYTEAESLYIGTNIGISNIKKRFQNPTVRRMGNESNYLLPYMPTTVRMQEISLARKYEQFTYLLGFGWGEAGKTMGLASYGKSLLDFSNLSYKNLDFSLKYSDLLEDIYVLQQLSGTNFHEFIETNAANIACTIQEYTEKVIIELLQNLVEKYSIDHICLGGGLFLNCILNQKILEKCKLRKIFIFPAAGDDGQAIGNAFFVFKKYFAQNEVLSINLPYLGFSYSNSEIESEIEKWNLDFRFLEDELLAETMAKAIANDKILAFHRGRTEIGPRALCHRSILANPTNPHMKDIINKRIKHREEFRPFAPVVIEEMEYEIFNLKQTSPYMLFAPTVKEAYRNKLPSITHIDYTARVQSVSKKTEPFVHLLLEKFAVITGVPVLLNTSFNIAGQPIVESPSDAIQTFLSSDMDALIIGNYWINK